MSIDEIKRLIAEAATGTDAQEQLVNLWLRGEENQPCVILLAFKIGLDEGKRRMMKEIGAAHVEGWQHGIKTPIYGNAWAESHAIKVVEGEV
jgi:hypothetical protein